MLGDGECARGIIEARLPKTNVRLSIDATARVQNAGEAIQEFFLQQFTCGAGEVTPRLETEPPRNTGRANSVPNLKTASSGYNQAFHLPGNGSPSGASI